MFTAEVRQLLVESYGCFTEDATPQTFRITRCCWRSWA